MKSPITPSLRSYITLAVLVLSAAPVFAQKADTVSPKAHQWGVRSEYILNTSGSAGINTLAIECKTPKHDFYVGATSPLFNYDSRTYGGVSGIAGYQFYPFQVNKHFNAYGFISSNFGTHAYSGTTSFIQPGGSYSDTDFKSRAFHMTTTIGVGFDVRLGNHFYTNVSMGIANRETYSINHFDNPDVPHRNGYSNRGGGYESRIGIGYRW